MEKPETTETDYLCPKGCGTNLEYGSFADVYNGIRGYSCSECNMIWTTGELKQKGVISDA